MIKVESPEDQKKRRTIVEMAHGIDKFLNGNAKGHLRENAFVILLFERGKEESNYLSNTDRPNAIRVMEAQIARLKNSVPQTIPEERQGPQAQEPEEGAA